MRATGRHLWTGRYHRLTLSGRR